MNENCCCFTGHRIIPNEKLEEISEKLYKNIVAMIGGGVDTFYAGGALGFDTLAAQTVLNLKEDYPQIKLILLLPCRTQAFNWSKKDTAVYDEIKRRSNEIRYFSDEYTPECMFKRNRALVDSSKKCICYLTSWRGGTAYTVKYADKCNLDILNLAENLTPSMSE